MRLDYAILQSEEGRDELARRALEILKSKSDDKTSYEAIADALQLATGLKLGSGVGWSQAGKWILPTRWSLGAIERP